MQCVVEAITIEDKRRLLIAKPGYLMNVPSKNLEIELVPSPEDPPLESDEYQAALQGFSDVLEQGGLDVSSHVLLIEAAGHEIAPHLGVFLTSLQTALPVVGTGLTSWFAGRYGREVRVKVGDIEVEANTASDAAKLLTKAQEIAQSKRVDG